MTPPIDPDLMLLYVAGATDAEETARIEAKLCTCCPVTHAAHVEAITVFHTVPFGLNAVDPPAKCRDALLRRVTAEVSVMTISSSAEPGAAQSYVNRFRWPLYVTSGLAACLAVALTMSLWNNREMESRNEQLAQGNQELSATLAGSENILSSDHLTLASLQTQDHSKGYGRVLFCPVTRQFQVTVFNLKPLPPGRAYELWLITNDQRKVPAGMFSVNDRGTATIIAHPRLPIDAVANAAVTDEPSEGSASPTGSIQLVGALPSK